MVRAVLEGVGFSLRHIVDISEELGVPVKSIALAGGGAVVRGWPQIIADICQRPVQLYADQDTVTRPLYAYCVTALEPEVSFEEALVRTFNGPPKTRASRAELAGTYEAIYHDYRSIAEFASGMRRPAHPAERSI
jgi:xylulokinase